MRNKVKILIKALQEIKDGSIKNDYYSGWSYDIANSALNSLTEKEDEQNKIITEQLGNEELLEQYSKIIDNDVQKLLKEEILNRMDSK